MDAVTDLVEHLRAAVTRDPTGEDVVPSLLRCFPDSHWRAVRTPGRLRSSADGPWLRDVVLPPTFADWSVAHAAELAGPLSDDDRVVVLPCVVETDALVLALEDATTTPLAAGTSAYPVRHRLSRVIEAVRAMAEGRLYAVGVIADAGFEEPRRATLLEGLPHLEREEAEDLYASYWGWCTPERLREALRLSR